jgi:hypothetical protein
MTRAEKLKHADQFLHRRLLAQELAPPSPSGPTADVYRIANYADGLVGVNGCEALRPRFDSGLRWADANNLQPGDPCWGRGVAGGVTWDGAFYRDLARYAGGGELFWSAYLKPGSAPGMKQGFWLNFGAGWAHLHHDDPAQMLSGAAPRIFYDVAPQQWQLVIEATRFVTLAVVEVWTGAKAGGNDPTGVFTRVSGSDPLPAVTVVAG